MTGASNPDTMLTKQRRIALLGSLQLRIRDEVLRSEIVTEEPYAVVLHVRVCGSRVRPTQAEPWGGRN